MAHLIIYMEKIKGRIFVSFVGKKSGELTIISYICTE